MKKYQIVGGTMVLLGAGRLVTQMEPWLGEFILKVFWVFINEGYAMFFVGCAVLLTGWKKQINFRSR